MVVIGYYTPPREVLYLLLELRGRVQYIQYLLSEACSNLFITKETLQQLLEGDPFAKFRLQVFQGVSMYVCR